MEKNAIRRFQCRDCPCHTRHDSGDRCCTGEKKPRRFRAGDPKVCPPSWCPRRKDPVEYRIYAYKDSETWLMRHWMQEAGINTLPSGRDFALRTEGYVDFNAAAFRDKVLENSPSDVLGVPVCTSEVIEIDDGLKPYYFLCGSIGVKVLYLFDSEAARRNQYQGEGV